MFGVHHVMAGEGAEQRLGPAGQDAPGVLVDRKADGNAGVARPRVLARQAVDDAGMDAGPLPGLFGRELGGLGPRQFEHRSDPDRLSVQVLDREAALQRRVDLARAQGVALAAPGAGRRGRAFGLAVPEIEDLVAAAVLKVAFAQQLPVIQADQERQVGLHADEVFLVELFLEQRMNQGHGEETVAARVEGYPLVGVDGCLVVIGSDGDDLGPVVLAFPQVVGIGDAGHVRVDPPEHDQVHLEPGVQGSADVGNPVGQRRPGEHVADGARRIHADGAQQRPQAQ